MSIVILTRKEGSIVSDMTGVVIPADVSPLFFLGPHAVGPPPASYPHGKPTRMTRRVSGPVGDPTGPEIGGSECVSATPLFSETRTKKTFVFWYSVRKAQTTMESDRQNDDTQLHLTVRKRVVSSRMLRRSWLKYGRPLVRHLIIRIVLHIISVLTGND